ncbi:MAG TPA: SOS response-associated peptidase [Steroidobacteraceae bacterium]
MCGRFAFYSPHEAVVRLFGVADFAPDIEPRYNIAPTTYVPTVRVLPGDPARRLALLYWGLVPSWAKDRAIGARLNNARSETLREKPSFRNAYQRRRCLVLADGYYEWQRSASGKQPYYIQLGSLEPMAIAALWETWRDPANDDLLESCTLVTTTPASSIAHIHDRMPVIVPPGNFAEWLDPANTDVDRLDRLLPPNASIALAARPVGKQVNNARNEGPSLIQPVAVEAVVEPPAPAAAPEQGSLLEARTPDPPGAKSRG